MEFSYGDRVTITTGFYEGETGTVINFSSVFEGEPAVETFVYNIRLDVAPNDVTNIIREEDLELLT